MGHPHGMLDPPISFQALLWFWENGWLNSWLPFAFWSASPNYLLFQGGVGREVTDKKSLHLWNALISMGSSSRNNAGNPGSPPPTIVTYLSNWLCTLTYKEPKMSLFIRSSDSGQQEACHTASNSFLLGSIDSFCIHSHIPAPTQKCIMERRIGPTKSLYFFRFMLRCNRNTCETKSLSFLQMSVKDE